MKPVLFKQTVIGKIPEDWDLVRLDEVTINITDGKHGDCQNENKSGYYFISCKDINNKSINYENARQITKEDFDETHKRTKLAAGDILLTNSGTIGRLAIAKDSFLVQKTTFQKSVAILKPKTDKIMTEYLYYSLLFNTARLIETSGGTTQKNLLLKDIRRFVISKCRLSEQQSIAKILSDLDSKIEHNNQMNTTLESIAQTLFKHWFVDFEFPNEQGKPYKNSGGKLVWSEELQKELPIGWNCFQLKEVLSSLESGRRPKGGIDPSLKEGIPSIGAENINGLGYYDYNSTKFISEEFFNQMNQGVMQNGDILLYKDGAKLGRKTMIGEGFPFEKCCVNEHVFIIRANDKLNQLYLYFYLDLSEITENIINLNANSAQPGINKESVGSLKIIVPDKELLDNFSRITKDLLWKLFANCLESQVLSEARDSLLPHLMSGKIRVS